ncbi:uncharacterized protein [Argopecten irradians]|uniref:uncharacterized protein isoform X2 n=1 Tax=Argopecten irradians TaxID=31199 RepID=UPI00371B8CAB
MLDYDEAEIGAVTAEFPDGKILMCAFHREQAWERWSRSEDNVPSEDREEFLRHLRAVADAPSEETLQEAIQSLEEKSFYRGSLRRYVESKWLSVKESWCRACIAPGFHLPVTTNNGVETLNKSLKHFYLKLSSSASLSNLVQIIFKDFLPDLYQTYLMLNFRSTSNFKPYQGIPSYLHDRPHHIVQHMLKRLSKGEEDFQSSDISLNTVGLYTVKSDSRKYTVSLGSESAYPDCSCDDFRRNFLPCKHMFAVFTFTNSDFLDLPLLYRSNPLLTLDTSSVKTHSGLCALTRQPVTEEAISSTKEDSIDTVKVQRNVLSKLKHIQTLVYLCKDNNTLQNANDLLEEVATALKENVPHDANLPLGPSAKLRKLPTRRKYFRRHGKYQRRVGAKAQKMRAAAVLEIGNMARKKPMKAKIHSKTRTPPSLDGPVLTDNPPSLDGPVLTDNPPSLDVPVLADNPPSLDGPVLADNPPSLDGPVLADNPPSPDGPVLADNLPSSLDGPVLADNPPSPDGPVLADNLPSSLDGPVLADNPPSLHGPVLADNPPSLDGPISPHKPEYFTELHVVVQQ